MHGTFLLSRFGREIQRLRDYFILFWPVEMAQMNDVIGFRETFTP
jgi:hypothetical protein